MHALLVAVILAFGPVPTAAHVAADGKAVFDQNCRKCHGVKGVPTSNTKRAMPTIPTLDTKTISKRSLSSVVELIKKGKGDMKPYADQLTTEEIIAVAEYVFTLANTKPQPAK